MQEEDSEQLVGLITMEPIGEQQNLRDFKFSITATETVGFVLLIEVLIWTIHFRKGFAWTSNPDLQFNWHPLLMILGMVVLYSQSILIYRALRDNRKNKLKVSHALIHSIAFILAVIALQAVFDFHNLSNPPKPNMYSLHSWIGLSAVIMFCCQWVAGFVSFLFPGLQIHHRVSYLPVHVFFGIASFVFAVTACLLGLNEKAIFLQFLNAAEPHEGVFINVIGLTLVIFASLVVYTVTKHEYRRVPRPEDEILLTGSIE